MGISATLPCPPWSPLPSAHAGRRPRRLAARRDSQERSWPGHRRSPRARICRRPTPIRSAAPGRPARRAGNRAATPARIFPRLPGPCLASASFACASYRRFSCAVLLQKKLIPAIYPPLPALRSGQAGPRPPRCGQARRQARGRGRTLRSENRQGCTGRFRADGPLPLFRLSFWLFGWPGSWGRAPPLAACIPLPLCKHAPSGMTASLDAVLDLRARPSKPNGFPPKGAPHYGFDCPACPQVLTNAHRGRHSGGLIT